MTYKKKRGPIVTAPPEPAAEPGWIVMVQVDGLRRFAKLDTPATGHTVDEPGDVVKLTGLSPGWAMRAHCEWFALCPNWATTVRAHPILRGVPICTRCDEKVERMSR